MDNLDVTKFQTLPTYYHVQLSTCIHIWWAESLWAVCIQLTLQLENVIMTKLSNYPSPWLLPPLPK